jgi:glycosyltransferase involved in cell wall biosynthesis
VINNKTIAVVVPCYNEETQIEMVIKTMPDFVDRIVVINDCSKDKTAEVVQSFWKTEYNNTEIKISPVSYEISNSNFNKAELIIKKLSEIEKKKCPAVEINNNNYEKDRIVLLNHKKNSGKGAGIVTGYKWCKDHGFDCIATMDGDGQMDPEELESICNPIINEGVDYAKGNRLIHRSALLVIPKIRLFGNSVLSILTKLASGYWRVSDTQTGYTAISNRALASINIHKIYRSYGYPNDMLIKLNIAMCTIKEVKIKPIYDIGENSKMKISKVIPRVSWLLFKSFFKRLWLKYLFRDFHPLFLLYNLSFILFISSVPYGIKIFKHVFIWETSANPVTVLAFVFLLTSCFQSFLFAMWMDIQDNERLYK